MIDTFIDNNPFEPSAKTAFILESVKTPKGVHKTVLNDILCIFLISQKPIPHIVHGIHI